MHSKIYKILGVLTFILFTTTAHASYDADNPSDLFCDPGRTAGSNPAFAGKPVSLLSGMETFSPSVDLTLGNIYPIRLTRSYNSKTSYDSPLGYGWAINYDKRLYTYADNSVTVRRDCGGKKRFNWSSPTGTYIGVASDTGSLVQNVDGSFIYIDKTGETEKYDAQGKLISMADAKGNSLVFTYTSASRELLVGLLPFNLDQNTPLTVAYDYHLRKIEEKDATGSLTGVAVTINYNTYTGRISDITDNANRMVVYNQDSIGNLTSVTGPGLNSSYGYTDTSNKHHLTSIDEGNGAYVNEYDAITGKVKKQTHGTGTIDFTYTTTPYVGTSVLTTIRDSSGTVLNTSTRTVSFDANGAVARSTDTFGNITSYIRDNNTAWILQKGQTDIATGSTSTTAYTYDAKGNVLTKTEALGSSIEKTTAYTYDPVFNGILTETVLSVVTPSLYSTITNSYDANGNLLTRTEAGYQGDGSAYSYTTSYTYYSNGKLHTIDGPRTDVNDVTTYTYDPTTGVLTSVTQPIIGTTTYSNFDALGNPQTVTDPNSNSTIYTYDTNGRVATVKAPGDTNATQYYYTTGCSSCGGAGKIDHITLPEGNTIWYVYDTLGNLVSISDNANNSINYTYDSEGNKLTEQIKDSGGNLQKSLSYSYDALSRLARITNPDSNYTQYGYDGFGNRKSVKDPNGNTTTYGYDSLNRLASTLQPLNASTSYTYDAHNGLKTVTDANNNTTMYKYDDKGRVYQVISPDTGTTTYGYDPAGNMVSKTDANNITISYVYDALNRLTKIDFPTDTDIVYAYDSCVNGKGHVCSMTDASGTTVYEYTAKGYVKKETRTIDSVQYVTQYTYDQNGKVKTMTYPSGKVITYNYSNNRVSSVLSGAASLSANINYKSFGGLSLLTYGNGVNGSIGYDNRYRITGIIAGEFTNLSYPTYDANGNVLAINDAVDPTKNKSFTYDALDRLSTATASGIWSSLGWTYDGVGNRQTEGTTDYSYTPGTNKLSGVGGSTYIFDNDGNTSSDGMRGYTYNQNQRLIQAVNGATTALYTYNGNGQRVKKTVGSTTTVYHYSLSGQLIAESNVVGTISAEYVYLNEQPLAKLAGTSVYYYANDHLGTPQKMMDNTGAVVWAADYKPFGEATISISTIMNNLRFPGQYYDAETGLNYNLNRTLTTTLGRYIEADPIGIREGRNHLFIYVRNNPVRYTDPSGLDSPGCDIIGKIPGFETDCNLQCCAEHDECFYRNNCRMSSLLKCIGTDPCIGCNSRVENCLNGCTRFNQPDPNNLPPKPKYFCRSLHRFITIPGDFPDRQHADEACTQ